MSHHRDRRKRVYGPIKWRRFKVFVKLYKSLLLIANIVKDAVSKLTAESPFEIN